MITWWGCLIISAITLCIGLLIGSNSNLKCMVVGTLTYKDSQSDSIGYNFWFTITYHSMLGEPVSVRYQVTKGLYYSLDVGQKLPILTNEFIRDTLTREEETNG